MWITALEQRAFWIGCGALLLVAALLGLRAERAVSKVLGGPQAEFGEVGMMIRLPGEARMARKDSLLAATVLSERDPFSYPPAKRSSTSSSAGQGSKRKSKPPTPGLQALLYDNIAPAVQLRVNGRPSDWLQRGGIYEGWQILEITSSQVTVAHAEGDTLVLP